MHIVRKKSKRCLLPSEQGGVASVGTSASGADVMAKVWLEEPWVLWAGFLILVILHFLPAATSARDGAS